MSIGESGDLLAMATHTAIAEIQQNTAKHICCNDGLKQEQLISHQVEIDGFCSWESGMNINVQVASFVESFLAKDLDQTHQ